MTEHNRDKDQQDYLLDQARTIRDEIEVSVFGPSGIDTPPCAEAWATAKLIAELRARVEVLENDRRTIIGSGSRLRVGLDAPEQAITRDRDETGDYVVVQRKSALTVEDCSKMPKHGENFLLETRNGEIHLDGYFTREDLIEIANTIDTSWTP